MDDLILRSLQGATGPAELRALMRWRQESPENEAHYQEFARVWRLADVGESHATPRSAPRAADLIRRADAGPTSGARAAARHAGRGWGMRAAAAAALLVIGFGVAELRAPESDLGFGVNEFVTGAGETATVGLRDGTVIRLAPQSRLRLTGTLEERAVSLDGRAYFAVARQERHPFRIRTDAGVVTVLGTRFDLAAERQDLRVVVVEGRVALAARGAEVQIGAGESSRVVEGTVLPVTRVPDVQSIVAWKGDFLAFQATPLRDAAREIEQQYDVRIVIADASLAERSITTWLADRTLDEVMHIVCMVVLAECVSRDGVITMRPAPADAFDDSGSRAERAHAVAHTPTRPAFPLSER